MLFGHQSARKSHHHLWIYSVAQQLWLHWSILSVTPEASVWQWHSIISPSLQRWNSWAAGACFSALSYLFGFWNHSWTTDYSFTGRVVHSVFHSVNSYWVPALGTRGSGGVAHTLLHALFMEAGHHLPALSSLSFAFILPHTDVEQLSDILQEICKACPRQVLPYWWPCLE